MTPETRTILTAAHAWLAVGPSRWCQGTYAMASRDGQVTSDCGSWTELTQAAGAGDQLACCASGAIALACITRTHLINARRAYAAIDALAIHLAARGLLTIHTDDHHLHEVTGWNDRHDTRYTDVLDAFAQLLSAP